MTIRIGINGFGRIGRTYLRAALAGGADVEVVAVNDLTDADTLATLLEWDSVAGHLDGVAVNGKDLEVAGRTIRVFSEPDPAKIPWGEVGADVVIESTGFFVDRDKAAQHLKGGAKKVIVSAPAKGDVPTFVLGVNDSQLDVSAADVFSNGSCTTNSLAPLARVLHDRGPAASRRTSQGPASGACGCRLHRSHVLRGRPGHWSGHPRARWAPDRRCHEGSGPGRLDHRPHCGHLPIGNGRGRQRGLP